MTQQERSRKDGGSPRGGSRTALLAVLMMVAAALILIALATYDPADEAVVAGLRFTDLFTLLSGDP